MQADGSHEHAARCITLSRLTSDDRVHDRCSDTATGFPNASNKLIDPCPCKQDGAKHLLQNGSDMPQPRDLQKAWCYQTWLVEAPRQSAAFWAGVCLKSSGTSGRGTGFAKRMQIACHCVVPAMSEHLLVRQAFCCHLVSRFHCMLLPCFPCFFFFLSNLFPACFKIVPLFPISIPLFWLQTPELTGASNKDVLGLHLQQG